MDTWLKTAESKQEMDAYLEKNRVMTVEGKDNSNPRKDSQYAMPGVQQWLGDRGGWKYRTCQAVKRRTEPGEAGKRGSS